MFRYCMLIGGAETDLKNVIAGQTGQTSLNVMFGTHCLRPMANYKMGPIVIHSLQMFVLYLTEHHGHTDSESGVTRNFVITSDILYFVEIGFSSNNTFTWDSERNKCILYSKIIRVNPIQK